MPVRMEVSLGPGHFVFDGDPVAPEERDSPTQFLADVYCGQMAGWIKMPLGTEVNLGPGHIVLDGDPASPQKGHSSPLLFLAHVYCGHGRPYQVLLSCCWPLSCYISEMVRIGARYEYTPCLKKTKTSHLWLAIALTHVNGFWYFLAEMLSIKYKVIWGGIVKHLLIDALLCHLK